MNERVEKLERELARSQRSNRLWKCAMLVVVAGTGLAIASGVGRGQPEQRELTVGTLIVDDGSGRGRVTVRNEKDGPTITMFDSKMKSRLVLGAGTEKASLTFVGEGDKPRVVLDGTAAGSWLRFCDTEGDARLSLGRDTGLAKLTFAYKGEKQAELRAFQNEPFKGTKLPGPNPSIMLYDENGRMKWGEQ
ncbi:MAG: hypothetical protein ACREJO_13755 [Phycisphaerales bacterium]